MFDVEGPEVAEEASFYEGICECLTGLVQGISGGSINKQKDWEVPLRNIFQGYWKWPNKYLSNQMHRLLKEVNRLCD